MTLGREGAGKLTPGSEAAPRLAAHLTSCNALLGVRRFLGHGAKNES